MKKVNSIFRAIILMIVIVGCGDRGRQQSTCEFITIDVTKSYPKKELILQNFMDVEYIVLETSDEFITQGVVKAIGKEIILVTNQKNDGDIFIFDRNGKGIRTINRKGQGGEEYNHLTEIVLDEEKNEMFVTDYSGRKIMVYDLFGNFKRRFNFADESYYTYVLNYDRDNLIGYKSNFSIENDQPGHIIISKQDGSITKEIKIPYKEIKKTIVTEEINGEFASAIPLFHQIILYKDNFVLAEASSDTMYIISSGNKISPFIVRTPSIYSMDPEIFLFPIVLTDRYYFMQIIKKVFDFTKMTGFPYSVLAYDKIEKEIFDYIVYNEDFSNKRFTLEAHPLNHEIASWELLEAYQLVEAYKKDDLKGRLKEIASTLDEEDNPVIMLVKHKKSSLI